MIIMSYFPSSRAKNLDTAILPLMEVELLMAFWEAWVGKCGEIGAWAIMTFVTEDCRRRAPNPPNIALINPYR